MATFRRSTHGTTYFFTVVSHHRRPILCDEAIRDALREAIIEVAQVYPFEIDAWVLLPDHLHTIWTLPVEDLNYSRRWALIKRKVSQQCGAFYAAQQSLSSLIKRESSIWQRRFWEHAIRDDADYERHMDYIYFNPVKHGLVKNVSAWPYSTFHRDVKKGLYPEDWGGVDLNFNDASFGE